MRRIILSTIAMLSIPWLAMAAQQTVTVGTAVTPADLDTNFTNIQANFTELYGDRVAAASLSGTILTLTMDDAGTITVDLAGLQDGTGTDDQNAGEVATDTTAFAGNLSGTDTTVQAALDTLDDMTVTGTIADDSIAAVKLNSTNAATDNYIPSYDLASGGFTWVENVAGGTDDQTAAEVSIADAGNLITGTNVETALQENRTAIDLNTAKETNTDDQTIDVFSFTGTTLSISLENDGVVTETVDLAGLQDGTGTDDQTASEVNITDTGAYYTGTEVETALQEVGADYAGLGAAAQLGATNGTIGDVAVWVDDGSGNASLPVDVANSPIADAGTLITAGTIEGALQENRTAINLNTAKVTNATHTGDVTGSGALTISTDAVDDTHINWGTGAGQVSADDIPDGSTSAIPTLTQESNWDTAYGWGDHLGLYETADATIVKSDEAETITSPWYFSGLTNAMINVESFAANTTATAQQVSGSYILATAAMTLTLPAAAEGYSFCFLAGQGVTAIIGVTPAAGDYIVVDGVRGIAATNYASSGVAGDKICMFAADANDWYVTSEVGTWSE